MPDAIRLGFDEEVQAESGVRYKNLQTLGTGGNAVTFLVVATSGPFKGVPFALKVFRRLSKPERREAFLKEIAFLKECSHPSIMRTFDEGVLHDEYPFLIAEYLPLTVQDVIRRGQATTVSKITYAVQMLSALAYLAALPIPVIHRDIKPRNMFIKGHSCVLGDFGLMKLVDVDALEDAQILKESAGLGMPFGYRTPDLVAYLNNGNQPTPKSDVFQLGLVVAELFSGKNPQRPAKDFLAPVQLNRLGSIPGTMRDVIANLIDRMLEPEPSKRESAAEFLDAWQGVLLAAAKQSLALEGKIFL